MENRNLGLGKFLISLPVVLGAVVLPAGVLALFYLIFTDFYQKGFLTGLLQGRTYFCKEVLDGEE
ncbi:hypothetical protein [Paenibacillus sp. FSL R5-0912]|uniref:hypothetical protein n=1 Tax=Paenibacillus sp. FSL R5-0912 TaxID=1536771 RepID=UPI0004F6A11C|nr:hypothetical protein [Paenibacillus sp. FSL R5-0912]AIQ40123.1 hypothetical protein R50912_08835 [Paenibacillus sp. FSL R5-0912]